MVYDLVILGQRENGTLQMMILDASARVPAGPSAMPIAATPGAAAASPAAVATPVVVISATPVTMTPGAATPTS